MLCGGPLRRTKQNGSRNSRKIVARRRRPIHSLSISLRRSEIDAQSKYLGHKSRMRTPHLTPPVYRTYSSELARLNRQNCPSHELDFKNLTRPEASGGASLSTY